jgi:predicted nucleic acid-binding protein
LTLAYADTSFLVSLYTPDANSVQAAAEMQRAETTFVFTALGEVELTNAFQLRVFRKELTAAQAKAGYLAFEEDVASGVLTVKPMALAVYHAAKQLAARHTPSLGVRTLDILHVAGALVLGAEIFYSFDVAQRKLTKAAGLALRPAGH